MDHRQDLGEPAITPAELDRERLRTYVEWADVREPAWYWPGMAVAITAWLTGYGLGPVWGALGALLVFLVSMSGLRLMASRGQVSMPRFQGMPPPLRRAYLPVLLASVWLVGVLVYVLVADSAPYLLLGAVSGAGLALSGAWTSARYRDAARRLARDLDNDQ